MAVRRDEDSRVIGVGPTNESTVGQELVGSVGVVELVVLNLIALAAGGIVNVRIEGPVMETHHSTTVIRRPGHNVICHGDVRSCHG